MDNSETSNSVDDSISSIKQADSALSVLAKMRRLKIQESIICATLHKAVSTCLEDNNTPGSIYNDHSDSTAYAAKVKNSLVNIKNMFEDVKLAINAHENLKDMDIQEMKRDIQDLDGKIRSMKEFICSELESLKKSEEELVLQINENPKDGIKIKSKVRIPNKQLNKVAPSPVRVMIQSPLKNSEVQEFQDFMWKSKNRYGGWNEYNHNTFVQVWNKYYDEKTLELVQNTLKEVRNNILLPQFIEDIHEKIIGLTFDDLLTHSKWYSEYSYLKLCQENALNRWKENKRKIKKPHQSHNIKQKEGCYDNVKNSKLYKKQYDGNKYENLCKDDQIKPQKFIRSQSLLNISNTSSENPFRLNEEVEELSQVPVMPDTSFINSTKKVKPGLDSSLTFSRPTEQWLNRCHAVHEILSYHDIERVEKLRVPNWRKGFSK